MPWKTGLMTYGHQQDIPETALWQAQNVVADLDGIMSKRPGLRQWGQTLLVPDGAAEGSTATAFLPLIETTGALVEVDTSGGAITDSLNNSYLQFNVPVAPAPATTTVLTEYYPGTSASTTWSFRLLLQGANLQEYTAASTVADTIHFRAIAAAGTGKEFALWLGGLYYKRDSDGTYVLIDGTELMGQGGWNAIEVRSGVTNTTIYKNETLVATIANTLFDSVTLESGALWELAARYESSGAAGTQYNARVGTPMYNDVAVDAFAVVPVVAITDFSYMTSSGATRRNLVAAAGSYIYVDRNEGIWRPLHTKQRTNVFFTTYQRTLVWSDNDGGSQASIWQWTGTEAPELLENAPPFLFMTEHQQRLVGVTRAEPLTVFISADRKPDDYINPDDINPDADLFDLLLDAATIPVPAKRSDVITAVWGDFYGSLIVWTTSSVWRITGNGVFSYSLSNISQTVGCANAKCLVMFGNDIWFASNYGIHSLQATDQFGDIQVQYPSIAIQSMWQQNSKAPVRVNRQQLEGARMAHYRSRSLIYVYYPVLGILIYNTVTQQWYGPWTIFSNAMESVQVEAPLTEYVMHGLETGRIGYTDFGYKADFDESYELLLESANINGRSIDPSLIGMRKSFKLLRLYFSPRGKWDYTVKWFASMEDDLRTDVRNQLTPGTAYTVSEDFRVSIAPDGKMFSGNEIQIAEIDLDVTGYALNFKITQDGLAQDLVLLGFQVEFEADGYEEE